MERKNKFLITLASIIIIGIFVLINNMPLNKETIPSKFVAGENPGFDLTPGRLNFGKIIPGSSGSRNILVENELDKPIKIVIKSSGDISGYMIVSKNNFILQPNESENLVFSVFLKEDTKYGEYNGQIEIISKKT